MDYCPWFFDMKLNISMPAKSDISSERAFQEEQNGENVSFIASSTVELWGLWKSQIYACGKGRHAYMYISSVCNHFNSITPYPSGGIASNLQCT